MRARFIWGRGRYVLAAGVAAAVLSAGSATAGSLITGAKIKDNTITGRDIRDGSLTARDFKAGSLPRGADGAPGPAGPAGAPGTAVPAPSGTPRVTALPNVSMKVNDPARAVATVGQFAFRMSCATSDQFDPLWEEYDVFGALTVRSSAGFFWVFSGQAYKPVDGAPFGTTTSTDTSGPGGESWAPGGAVARVVGDFAVAGGGCTLSNAKAYVWG
jgi:hypothetical protein